MSSRVGSIEKPSHFDHDFPRQLSLPSDQLAEVVDFRADREDRAELGHRLDRCRGNFRESLGLAASISGLYARASW